MILAVARGKLLHTLAQFFRSTRRHLEKIAKYFVTRSVTSWKSWHSYDGSRPFIRSSGILYHAKWLDYSASLDPKAAQTGSNRLFLKY